MTPYEKKTFVRGLISAMIASPQFYCDTEGYQECVVTGLYLPDDALVNTELGPIWKGLWLNNPPMGRWTSNTTSIGHLPIFLAEVLIENFGFDDITEEMIER